MTVFVHRKAIHKHRNRSSSIYNLVNCAVVLIVLPDGNLKTSEKGVFQKTCEIFTTRSSGNKVESNADDVEPKPGV